MDTNTIVKRFFWGAFAAFLLASIPHVAYFFRAYEPVAQGADDIWEWVVSYGIAASIDITIFLLSVTVSGLQRRNARKSLIFSVWIFIFALAVLSWYINDRYALHFMNTTMMSATALTINLWSFHVIISDINPLIASCFQILAIAYTWISDKLTNNEVPPTARELEVLAEELAAVKIAKDKIKSINKGRVTDGTIDAVDDTFKVLGHVAGKLKREKKAKKVKENVSPVVVNKESDQVAQEADVVENETEVKTVVEDTVIEDTDELFVNDETEEEETYSEPENEPSTDPEMEAANVTHFPETGRKPNAKVTVPLNVIDIATRRKPLTLSEAVQVLGVSEKTVREWKRSGKLSTVQNGKFITASSVREMLKSRVKVS
jgi:DNA-binding transcriptional regulator YiaG